MTWIHRLHLRESMYPSQLRFADEKNWLTLRCNLAAMPHYECLPKRVVDWGTSKLLVSDDLPAVIAPLFPPEPDKPKGGRPRLDDRKVEPSIIFVLKSGIGWELLPSARGLQTHLQADAQPLSMLLGVLCVCAFGQRGVVLAGTKLLAVERDAL